VSDCLLLLGPPVKAPPAGQPAAPGPWQMISQTGSGAASINAPYGAWLLPIPAESNADATAVAFVAGLQLPIGTTAYVIDLTGAPGCCQEFTLAANWTQVTISP
jgi:hypothetical protein